MVLQPRDGATSPVGFRSSPGGRPVGPPAPPRRGSRVAYESKSYRFEFKLRPMQLGVKPRRTVCQDGLGRAAPHPPLDATRARPLRIDPIEDYLSGDALGSNPVVSWCSGTAKGGTSMEYHLKAWIAAVAGACAIALCGVASAQGQDNTSQ
jgi:hypothetical protein